MKTNVKKSSVKKAPQVRNRIPKRTNRLPRGPHGGVELLLIHSVEDLGNQGDVVEVRPGYAYNFLIPHGLATFATDHHKRMIGKHRARLQAVEKAQQADLRKRAVEISKQSITIEANATDDGHLYGSVGAPEIVAALKKNGVQLTVEQIRLEGLLKELGLYTVNFRLASEIEGELKVWVVPTVGAETEPS
ncbi:MAG: 50S ribosomal protein L9 [Pirellulales bacterium]|nr:50S ribosomal protein L9 [Pirellulales bacterium]